MIRRLIQRFWIPAAILFCIAWLNIPAGCAQGPKPHRADLQWTAPTDFVVGDSYNVYRGTVSGGPYAKINIAPVADVVFSDTTAQANTTYFDVVTHATATNESVFSNEVKAVIPANPLPPVLLILKGVV
jgi:fibronectin type 3 domain-containing protein